MTYYKLEEVAGGDNFDPTSLYKNVPFTQASFYGDWQRHLGRTVRNFIVKNGDKKVSYFQLIKYPLLAGKNYIYIPYGPVSTENSLDFYIELKKELKKIAQSENAVFVRLDFTPKVSGEVESKIFTKAPNYTYHSAYFQPRVEWFLKLDKPENEILEAMNKKTRYSIRMAEKMEVKTEIVTENYDKYFDVFYNLMLETAKRNGFGLHKKDYYQNIFKSLTKENSFLSIARYGDKILVVDLMIVYGGVANYVFGNSSNEERNRMPTYLAQWKAICFAKQLGLEYYNFGGISTENGTYSGWEGLTLFKKRFGGAEMIRSDFFDIVVNPFWYHLYNLRKKLKRLF